MTIAVTPLERLELRTVWANEGATFTPWLYMPATLEQLGKAIGLGRLEPVSREQQVGDFRADIVAKDLSGGQVLIENQLEQTDHKHLGQLLTYAAGLPNSSNVVSVIWVAARIRAEHAEALRWLNARTPDNVGFYAVEVTAWTIAGSSPGYRFDVVVRPDMTIQLGETGERPLTPDQLALRNYWSAFRDFLDERGAQHWMRPKLPKAEWWGGGNFGRPGINIYAIVKPKSKSIAVLLELSEPADYRKIYEALLEDKSQIEDELGQPANWDETNVRRQISSEHPVDNPLDATTQREQFEWILSQLERFRAVFRDRILKLSVPQAAPTQGALS